eukprot:GHVH01011712.1.p1 GENE.GHVH01011712.1~~GHVH01011712.1.p1  ORF type:complete len:607 (+),score=66.26 GHVH01011712.1:108-1928(+)
MNLSDCKKRTRESVDDDDDLTLRRAFHSQRYDGGIDGLSRTYNENIVQSESLKIGQKLFEENSLPSIDDDDGEGRHRCSSSVVTTVQRREEENQNIDLFLGDERSPISVPRRLIMSFRKRPTDSPIRELRIPRLSPSRSSLCLDTMSSPARPSPLSDQRSSACLDTDVSSLSPPVRSLVAAASELGQDSSLMELYEKEEQELATNEEQELATNEVCQFIASPFENGRFASPTVLKEHDARHPLDHPMLRFCSLSSKRDKMNSVFSRLYATRKLTDTANNQSMLSTCPLCSPEWFCPSNSFSNLVEHYEEVHWNRRRSVVVGPSSKAARESYVIHPCYKNHGDSNTIIFEYVNRSWAGLRASPPPALLYSNRAGVRPTAITTGLEDQQAVLVTKLYPERVKTDFQNSVRSISENRRHLSRKDWKSTELNPEHLQNVVDAVARDVVENFAEHSNLTSTLIANFGPNVVDSEMSDRIQISKYLISTAGIKCDEAYSSGYAESNNNVPTNVVQCLLNRMNFGLLSGVLPHFHCPFNKYRLNNALMGELAGNVGLSVHEWNNHYEHVTQVHAKKAIVCDTTSSSIFQCPIGGFDCSFMTTDFGDLTILVGS